MLDNYLISLDIEKDLLVYDEQFRRIVGYLFYGEVKFRGELLS